MKRIVSNNNYVQLEEFNIYTNRYVLQLGFALSGLTYKIENRNVKFYLKEDYFYKNSVWSADIPLEIDGKTYMVSSITANEIVKINEGERLERHSFNIIKDVAFGWDMNIKHFKEDLQVSKNEFSAEK